MDKIEYGLLEARSRIWVEVDRTTDEWLDTTEGALNNADLKQEMCKTAMGLIRLAQGTAEIAGAAAVERELREIERTMELLEATYQIPAYSRIINTVRNITKDMLPEIPY